ncbi:MAG: YihY/virulence factor BrkB family protein [Candidatus Eremiobacteraeota bacterium]|nr:YihY/virulence factor BrkB family protein [Candidatus Eremiobacteraeota bacterium]
MNDALSLLKTTLKEYQRHQSQWLAAAIAYFAVFAIAPLIIVVVEIGGFVLGHHRVLLDEIYGYLRSTAGPGAALAVQSIVRATFNQRHAGIIAQIIAWSIFVFAAIGLFASIQQALNTIWDIPPRKKTLGETIKGRAMSFGVIIIIAAILLASLGLNTVLTAAGSALASSFPALPTLMKVIDFVISFAVIAALLALLFEFLPECKIQWRDVWIGALVTAFLFVIGQFLLGWYLGRAAMGSTYGAFGSLIIFLLWTNYSAQIVLFGAEFTHVYAERFGSRRPLEVVSRHPRAQVSQ